MSRESNEFESEIAEKLGERGFWATVVPKGKDGSQPADIIALNHKGKHLIDAKLCKSGRFNFERMEDNQRTSMLFFAKRCGGKGWFALKFPDDSIYIVEDYYLKVLEASGKKSVRELPEEYKLENWLNEYSD